MEMVVDHGTWVECRPGFFVEGAWGGPFEAGKLDRTEVVFGSGAVVRQDAVCFVSAVATTDYLYYRPVENGVTVANSLSLLLAATDDRLDPGFPDYHRINESLTRGIFEYRSEIPTAGGKVYRLIHWNLSCSPGSLAREPKPEPPAFGGYQDYRSYLDQSYQLLARNARDPGRTRPLKLYSTQSRGYDTTAINVVAAPEGLDGVFTITRGKGRLGASHENDDGTEIARQLGLAPIISIDRDHYRTDPGQEVYLHASISENQDANLHEITRHLKPPALLLTGTLGEIWYTRRCWVTEHSDTMHPGLARWDLGTHGLTEVRLRAGYVQAALPFLGARRRDRIVAITESEEMAPWRLGNDYDRPIPRRMGESAGIARESFGRTKIASVVEWAIPNLPSDGELRREYLEFLETNRLLSRWKLPLLPALRRFNQKVSRFWWRHYWLLRYPLGAAYRALGVYPTPPIMGRAIRGSLFAFAVNRVATEYKRGLDSPPPPTG